MLRAVDGFNSSNGWSGMITVSRSIGGWEGDWLLPAHTALVLRGWGTVGVSRYLIVAEISGISDLESYGRFELLWLKFP